MTGKYPRPTSPHLQIYRLPLTAVISISHRITGVLLSLGLIIIVFMLYFMSSGEVGYNLMQQWTNFWLVKIVYWGFVFSLFFHLCHGLRHLLWDIGEGFAMEKLQKHAILELAASVLLTLGWLILGY